MGLWDTVEGWFKKEQKHFIHERIEGSRVNGVTLPVEPAKAGLHYFRLRLAQMFLNHKVAWFQSLYPAVHSLVRLSFGNQQVEIPNVADSTRLGIRPAGGQGDIVIGGLPLTPTLPFNGGMVSIHAGLVALTGENYLNGFLKTLGSFAALLTVPQLSAALAVAQPLALGIQELFSAGNGRLHLGLMQSFDAKDLRNGYIALVRAGDGEIDRSKLRVSGDVLFLGEKPLTGFDYLLLKIEVFTSRDDADQLTSIATPFGEAKDALAKNDVATADECLRRAILAALRAPELTEAHRRSVVTGLKARYKEAKELLSTSGFGPGDGPSLQGVLDQAETPEAAFALGPITFEEALGLPA